MPKKVIIYFEIGMISSMNEQFKDLQNFVTNGCLFHLSQNIRKKVQEIGLMNRYSLEPNFQFQVKMFLSLSFLPASDVIDGYDFIIIFKKIYINIYVFLSMTCISDQLYDDLFPLAEYFEKNYTGTLFRKPLYKPEFWTVYDRVMASEPRTTNHAEGWNHGFNTRLDADHPNIYK